MEFVKSGVYEIFEKIKETTYDFLLKENAEDWLKKTKLKLSISSLKLDLFLHNRLSLQKTDS